MSLSIKDILLAPKKLVPFELQEGVCVFLKRLSVKGVMECTQGDVDPVELTVRMIVHCVCDEHGNPIFSPDQAEEVKEMENTVFNELSTAVMKVNGIAVDTQEEVEKN